MAEVIEMEDGRINSVTDIETKVLRISAQNGDGSYFCFVVDINDETEPHGNMRLWPSEDLEYEVVNKIKENSRICVSAERDDENDMVITNLRLIHV